jgi:hypothetical protein
MLSRTLVASASTQHPISEIHAAEHPRIEMSDLKVGQIVAVECPRVHGAGKVDAVADDASVAWLHMNDGQGRILIHTDDAPRLYFCGHPDCLKHGH